MRMDNNMAIAGFDTPWLNGFHITFENGYTLSIQWKSGNYCENYYNDDFCNRTRNPSKDAEIAILDPFGELLDEDTFNKYLPENLQGDFDNVCGYVTPEDALYVMNQVANIPKRGE